jgi:UDP-N-acetyl-D-glucosamine/UDP-N-acetyl-D-galactosamine dehydrogenase
MKTQIKIAVIGLGYVGLPIALEFSKYHNVTGFDISKKRIESLKNFKDSNNETNISKGSLKKNNIIFTNNKYDLKNCNIYVVCVPTPVFKSTKPDLRNLINACNLISKFIKINDIVIFESTVYPSTTETICLPLLEKGSNLKCNTNNNSQSGFFIGYSPERINPGDQNHNLSNTKKLVSSNSSRGLQKIYSLYKKIIKTDVIKVNSIQVCESSKIIENVQRDVNIALMNEFAKIFRKMDLDINEIIKYASTKWNFIKFYPGLVGGHCIGVDPYYLSYIAKKNNIDPKLIISGRKINDNMYLHIIKRISNICLKKNINISKSNVLIMGYAFKENCSDIRNTQVKKIHEYYKKKSKNVEIYDPLINNDKDLINKLTIIKKPKKNFYKIIIVCVPHKKILSLSSNYIKQLQKSNSIVFDLKNSFNRNYFSI